MFFSIDALLTEVGHDLVNFGALVVCVNRGYVTFPTVYNTFFLRARLKRKSLFKVCLLATPLLMSPMKVF